MKHPAVGHLKRLLESAAKSSLVFDNVHKMLIVEAFLNIPNGTVIQVNENKYIVRNGLPYRDSTSKLLPDITVVGV